MVGRVALNAPQHFGSVETFYAIAVQGAAARSAVLWVSRTKWGICLHKVGDLWLLPLRV